MTETGFGPGGHVYTHASVPAAPGLSEVTSVSVMITIGGDTNPEYTEYALFNETAGKYVDSDGGVSVDPVWQTRDQWGTLKATGLIPATTYSFKVKARNQAEEETAFGDESVCTTHHAADRCLSTVLSVVKMSSTISPPSFMSGLTASIRVAGKSLNDFGFHVDSISGLDLPQVIPDEEFIPGGHSWKIWDEYFAPKRVVLEGIIHGISPGDLRLRIAYLKSFFTTFEGNPWRSTAPVRLERSDLPDRHWRVFYDSIDVVETLGKRDLSSSARLRIAMKCPTPYAEANDVSWITFSAAAGTFKAIDLGNAPSDAVYVIRGESTNPTVTIGDMIFFCDFSQSLAYTDVENTVKTGAFEPEENETGAYRTTETGTGIHVTDGNTVTYTAKGNVSGGSWIVVLSPQWQSTEQTTDVVVLEHRADDDNYLRLYWDGSEQRWVFRKRAGGDEYEAASSPQAFTTGTTIVLGFTYDATNAGGMKLFVDGNREEVNGDLSVLADGPSELTLHNGEGNEQPDAVFDMIAGWSRMLSQDEMIKIVSNPEAVCNLNTTFFYDGELSEGDLLLCDSARKTAELFDISEGERTNVLDAISGMIPVLIPGRRRTASDRTQTVVYTKNEAVQVEVRYRRRYL